MSGSFVDALEKRSGLHDWYLEDFFLSNTGKQLHLYSKVRTSTIQLGFYYGTREHVMLIYKNVTALHVENHNTRRAMGGSPTGFGCSLHNRFDIIDAKTLCHGWLFEAGVMEITFEKVSFKKIPCGIYIK